MSKHKYKIIGVATLLGVATWFLNALLEYFETDVYFHNKSFYDLLIFDIPREEFITRAITLFAFIFFGFSIARYIAHIEQSEAKLQESEQRLSRLAAQLITIQENERSRISKELHDELGQAMMLLQFQLNAIYEKLQDNSLRRDLKPMLEYLEDTIENLRRLTEDLSPVPLENLGLVAAVGFLIEEISKSLGIESAVDLEEVDHLLSPTAQLNLYRIFQEALTNIGKHAKARHLSSVLRQQNGQIYLEIADDGRGFDVPEALSNSHKTRKFGLNTMNERVRLLGGVLKLESQKGSGTKIIITIPGEGEASVPLSHTAGR
jgi:signal transduction histidine kinase